MKPLKKYHRPNVFNHEQITQEIDASPSKCIDKDIAKKHGCSESYVHTLRFQHTKVRFNTGIPRVKTKPNKDMPRENYLQKIHKLNPLTRIIESVPKEYASYRVAQVLVCRKMGYVSMDKVWRMKGEGR